jgi:SRSO17 transposase
MSLPTSDGVTERLSQFLDELGRHLWDRRQRASFAMYMLGLLSSLPRKSVEPISALFVSDPDDADAVHQRLLHFLGAAPWPDADVRLSATRFALSELALKAPIQSLIIDDTSFVKSGSHSVGVQRQYCGALGKVANCQVVVSLTAATHRAHLPIDMQPYLPHKWTDSQALREQAHIPSDVTFQTKPEIALSLLARAKQNGIPQGVVLADAGYGDSSAFRDGIRRLGLHYAVGIQLDTTVQLLANPEETVSVAALLERVKARPFRRHTWREGTKGSLHARFAFFAVRVPKSEFPEVLWLVVERRDGAKQRDRAYLCSLPQSTPRKRLVYVLKDRWCTEAAYQESKQQLGMDQYQGRLYPGLQHHLSAVICAYAYVIAERERLAGDGNPRAAPMQRTAQIPQRHAPHSIATLRKRLALALTPWLLNWLPERASTLAQSAPNPGPTTTLTDGTDR